MEVINTIIEAISVTLNQEFGDDYEIHMEEVKQDLKEPCFFIFCVNPAVQQFPGKRYFRENQFVIQYFPESQETNRECASVAERLLWCLEVIDADGPIRGTKMKYEIVDGILHFFVNYDCFMRRVEENTPMETLQSRIGVKGGE